MSASETKADLRIFISYRRSDCQPQANGLYDGLSYRLRGANIFMDIDSIPYGVDFEEHIRAEIEACDVVLVLVGDNWLDPVTDGGERRIDQEGDFVRLEIENALSHPSVKVIPVLVEGARMPTQAELPKSISRLARLNAIELSDRRWKADLERLAAVVEGLTPQASVEPSTPEPPSITLSQLNARAIDSVVHQAYSPFQTKDISESPAVLTAHGALGASSNYHSMVGSYLSRNAAGLGIRSAGKGANGRGEIWERALPATAPPTLAPVVAHPPPQPSPHIQPPMPNWPGPPAGAPAWPVPAPRSEPRARATPMVVITLVSFGLLFWIPFVRALRAHPEPMVRRKLVQMLLAGLASLVIGLALFGAAPTDATGTATGPMPVIGFLLFVVCMALGVLAAVRYKPGVGRDK